MAVFSRYCNRLFTISILIIFIAWTESHAQLLSINSINDLDTTVNSTRDEVKPVLSPDGSKLYFSRKNHVGNVGGKRDRADIWVSERQSDGSWGEAKNLGAPVNNRYENYVFGFSGDGEVMFLENHYPEGEDKILSQGISVSYLRGGNWSFPEKLPVNYFRNLSENQGISLSADKRIMLLCVESYGTYGNEDIYVSFLKPDNTWAEPLNLGRQINTNMEEVSAFLLPDNETMVFSTNGRDGFGSQDLFVTKRLDDTWKNWTEPENLGDEVNSPGREYYFFMLPDSEIGYFSSTRNSDEFADLRTIQIAPDAIPEQAAPPVAFEAPKVPETPQAPQPTQTAESNPAIIFKGRIYNEDSGAPISARISLRPSQDVDFQNLMVDTVEGSFQFELPVYDQYQVQINSKGYMSVETTLNLSSSGQLSQDFALSPLEVGKTFRLDNVLFKRGTTDLIDSSFVELNRIADLMKENPEMEVELAGHTDNQGLARPNLRLSRERVERVKEYLVERGIDEKRIDGKGYGGSRPVASNASETTRKLNRRVEFIIKKME